MVVEVAQTFAQHRARRQQHDGISPALSTYLLKVGNQLISQLIMKRHFHAHTLPNVCFACGHFSSHTGHLARQHEPLNLRWFCKWEDAKEESLGA